MHILVVDDDQQILELMKAILGDDFTVHTFERGEPALEFVEQLPEDDNAVAAAFIDLTMPGPSGLAIAKRLRRKDDRINTILMTGSSSFNIEEIDSDLVDNILLLEKPFKLDEVLLQARYFKRSWLRDRDLEHQKEALKLENIEKENIATRNQAVLETALDCIITIDSQGCIIEWNPAAEQTFGYSKKEILGARLSEKIVPHASREGHRSGMAKYLNTGVGPILGQRIEVTALHKTGREFPVELTVHPIILDDTKIFTAYLRDISSEKAAAAQLLLQSKALQAAANGIIITDPNGIIIWANSSFCELTGYAESEVLGQHTRLQKSNIHDDYFYKEMWDTILAEKVWVGEIHNRRKNGDIYTEEMTITPVKNDEGELTHFIAIKQDVTAQRQIDEKLDRNEQNQRIINYFATSLLGSNTVDEILWDIAHNCISELDLEDAVIYLVSEDGKRLVQKAAYGSNKAVDYKVLNPIEIPIGDGIVGSVAASGTSEIIPDVRVDPRYIKDDALRASEIAIPIIYENKVIGVIDSEHSEADFFKEYHLHILEAIASLASNKLMRALSLQQIEESEKKYRSIFESIQDVYAEVDYESGLIMEISPSIRQASGYDREEMIGMPMAEFFTPPGVPSELMEALLEKGDVNDFTVKLKNKHDSPRTISFSVSLLKDEKGNPEKIVGTMRDITERKQVMRQIEESEERLQIILNVLPTGIIIADPESHLIEEANPAAGAIIGVTREDLLGSSTKEMIRLNDDAILGPEADFLQEPQDLVLTRQDHTELPILLTKLRISIRDKAYDLLSFVNNSLQKEAEAALKTNIEMKTNFVSNLSHELRTPMTSIYGFSGTILRDENMPDEVRLDFIRIIYEESQRLTRLIENVLDLSRMEAGRMIYNMQALQLDVIIEEALKTQQVIIRDKGIQLTQDIMLDPPLIEADQDSMNQLIINLVSNAIKFSDMGSHVSIRLSIQDQNLEFCVQDSGIGIPDADIPHIFDKFYRVANQGREDQGTGIGLSIVKEIVDRHQGSINVSSQLGVGTTFCVALPLIEMEETDNLD